MYAPITCLRAGASPERTAYPFPPNLIPRSTHTHDLRRKILVNRR